MTKAKANGDDGTGAVETRVKAQVKELHGVAALLRDLTQAHDNYTQDFGKLSASAPANVAAAPRLRRVTRTLEKIVAAMAQAHSALASELGSTVVTPLEAFEKQQRHQTKQLVGEIDSALQNVKQLDATLKHLVHKLSATDSSKAAARVSPRRDSTEEADNQETEDPAMDTGNAAAERAKLVAHVREVKDKRDRERDVVRQRLEELDLTNEQQGAVVHAQWRRCFEVFTRHTTGILTEIAASVPPSPSSSESQADTETAKLDDATQAFDLHVEGTSWMIALFSQMLPIEEAMIKRLQALLKSHPLADVATVFAPSNAASATTPSPETTTLWDLAHSHKQLTANLSDPIGRTLRFSKQKQETIRKELLESMDETQKLVHATKAKLKDKELRLVHVLQQEQQRHELPPPPPPPLLGGTGAEAVLTAGLSTFGLRNAVAAWSKQMSSPKKTLFKSKSTNWSGLTLALGDRSPTDAMTASSLMSPTKALGASPKHSHLEKEVADTRAHLATLEKNEAAQRDDMVKTLQSTALIASKTMELMVHDHLKNIAKAMNLAAAAIGKWSDRVACAAGDKGGVAVSSSGRALQSFRDAVHFDSGEWTDSDEAKLLDGDMKAPAPEKAAAETDTEHAEEDILLESRNAHEAQSTASTSDACATTRKSRVASVSTEVLKLGSQVDLHGTKQGAVHIAKQALTRLAASASSVFHRVERSADAWLLIVLAVAVVSLARVSFRVGRLDDGWRELAALQHENARSLQQTIELMGQ